MNERQCEVESGKCEVERAAPPLQTSNLTLQTPSYLQPAFLICAVVLACAGVGMSLVTQRLGLYLKKEPLPLQKPLSAMAEGGLLPYKVLAKVPIENQDILRSLGTEDYLQWVLEDPREPADSPVRKLLLFITYYGHADRVPHVPEECYTGGGYQRLATNAISFRVGASDRRREIPGRYLLFERTPRDLGQAVPQFPVLYLFRVNGAYAGSRDEARLALNKNIFSKHSYFCKIEMVFNQFSVSPPRERAAAASEKLLDVLLPVLEQEHWDKQESPAGTIENSPPFQRWVPGSETTPSPVGAKGSLGPTEESSFVPGGTAPAFAFRLPSDESLGYWLSPFGLKWNDGEFSWREEGV